MKKALFLIAAIVIVSSMLLAGCGGDETTTTESTTTTTSTTTSTSTMTTTSTSTTATTSTSVTTTTSATSDLGDLAKPAGGKEGGRLQLVGSGNIANIGDPNALSNPGDAAYAFPALEPLLRLDKQANLQPFLAKDFKIADDGSSMTLYLREGVKFQDGTDFNAEAAKYNLDNGIHSTIWPNLLAVDNCEIVDDYTVRLNFKGGKWDWYAAKSLTGFFSACMFSPKSLEENDESWRRTHVVGTGPFILTNFERDQKLTYERNDSYWRGAPYLDGVDYNIIPDTTVQLLAYKAGEVDTIGVQPSDAQGLLDEGWDIIESYDMCINLCLIPSSRNPDSPLADIRVRQAVAHAIDREALVEGLTYGYGTPSQQHFVDFQAEYDPTVVGYPYDVAKAKELLTEAGYPDGFTTSIYLADFLPLDLPLALQDMLSNAGITLNIEKVSIVQLNEMISPTGAGWEGFMYSYAFPGVTVDAASALGNGPLNGNTTWYSCAQPQELLDLAAQGTAETDPDARAAIYREISRKMTDEYCQWIFLYWSPTLQSVSPVLRGYTIGQYTEPWPYAFAWRDE